jgi:hypothetical protein
MKINIALGTELVKGAMDVLSQFRPFLKVDIQISSSELKKIRKTDKEFLASIGSLIRFSVQHME